MNAHRRNACGGIGPNLTESMKLALKLLREARTEATKVGHNMWDFACEVQALKDLGVTVTDIRSMLCRELIEHGIEQSTKQARSRKIQVNPSLQIQNSSCFILSERGLDLLDEIAKTHSDSNPHWDAARKELRVGAVVAKQFRQPARNQEAVLAAFEEDGWPPRIDDPLPGVGTNRQIRLHDTIKKLNRQRVPLIRFLCDGSGQGVLWEARTG